MPYLTLTLSLAKTSVTFTHWCTSLGGPGWMQRRPKRTAQAKADLEGHTGKSTVIQQVEQAVQMGVSSVPLFVFNKQFAVSGARQPAYLLAAMEHSLSAVQVS